MGRTLFCWWSFHDKLFHDTPLLNCLMKEVLLEYLKARDTTIQKMLMLGQSYFTIHSKQI